MLFDAKACIEAVAESDDQMVVAFGIRCFFPSPVFRLYRRGIIFGR